MASLDEANTTYILQSYDVVVGATLSGTFNATATGGQAAHGTGGVASYTAIAPGSTLSPALTSRGPDGAFPGNGPDPKKTTTINENSGVSTGAINYTNSSVEDLGYTLANDSGGGSLTSAVFYTPITNWFERR